MEILEHCRLFRFCSSWSCYGNRLCVELPQLSRYVFKLGVTPAAAYSRHVRRRGPVLISAELVVEQKPPRSVKLEQTKLAAAIKYA